MSWFNITMVKTIESQSKNGQQLQPLGQWVEGSEDGHKYIILDKIKHSKELTIQIVTSFLVAYSYLEAWI